MTTRSEFLAALRAGMRGMPAPAIDEVIADYAAHFAEGVAEGRGESDVSAALGDPLTLADELRVEHHIDYWRARPSARSAFRLLAASVAFAAADTALVLVIVPLVALLALVWSLGIGACLASGVGFIFTGPSLDLPGGITVVALCSLGLISLAVSLAALGLLIFKAVVSMVGRYVRLQYRLLPRSFKTGAHP